MKQNLYRAFGLNILSEIELLALLTDGLPDLTIRYDVCPEMTEEALVTSSWMKASRNQVLITIDQIGSFYVHDGIEIIMDISPDCDRELVRMYLLGTCMGAILQQRGIMSLHGSCICKDGKAMVITGQSGAGKSTLAAEFVRRGWHLMSDDITPVLEKDGIFYAQSTYPGRKLWQDTVERQDMSSQVTGKVQEDEGSIKFQLDAKEGYIDTCLPLVWGVHLIVGSKDLRMDEYVGFSKTDVLMRNLYRGFLAVDKEGKSKQLQNCMKLSGQLNVYLVARPRDKICESDIAEWVLNELEITK